MKLITLSSLALSSLLPHLAAAPLDPAKQPRTFIANALQFHAFSPPEPIVAKSLPDIRIEFTVTAPSEAGKSITIQRGEASILPDIPPPPPPKLANPATKPSAEELARQIYRIRHSINLGATVYNHQISEVHWVDQETKISYQAFCGFDIGLIAGIGSFVRDGETYSVSVRAGNIDLNFINLSKRKIPAITSGQILIIHGDSKATHATAPLLYIRDLIESEKPRLITYQADRKKQQLAAAAWAAAHPPTPRDETFILRPHRGSRYLSHSQSNEKEGTSR